MMFAHVPLGRPDDEDRDQNNLLSFRQLTWTRLIKLESVDHHQVRDQKMFFPVESHHRPPITVLNYRKSPQVGSNAEDLIDIKPFVFQL